MYKTIYTTILARHQIQPNLLTLRTPTQNAPASRSHTNQQRSLQHHPRHPTNPPLPGRNLIQKQPGARVFNIGKPRLVAHFTRNQILFQKRDSKHVANHPSAGRELLS